mmetsp:Transcript_46768/g.71514  ORF Transcript_46768/g.71514 Transcript_46768/m.71514 type:complete len:127 (+) Transcript_46768:88-468(+)
MLPASWCAILSLRYADEANPRDPVVSFNSRNLVECNQCSAGSSDFLLPRHETSAELPCFIVHLWNRFVPECKRCAEHSGMDMSARWARGVCHGWKRKRKFTIQSSRGGNMGERDDDPAGAHRSVRT